MGPPDRKPAFPTYDSLVRSGFRVVPGQKYYYPCNWLQILKNAMDPAHTAYLHTIVSGAVFTPEFGFLPELDSIGMIYVATRRVGENVWARMVENVMPNLQQVSPIWEDGKREHGFSGPMMSRWIVPLRWTVRRNFTNYPMSHCPLWISNFTKPSSRIFNRRDWQASSFTTLARFMTSYSLSGFSRSALRIFSRSFNTTRLLPSSSALNH
jgi:phenylpropionate dioxygenase-like ring-hydroxylating dioxygenase large terminal subunit